ncbi:MAG: T9SS type A sorting domain-containing protein [Saprospiraceae bacterium]|nr:T9SS type A sorting domain-containing protein [Saprospiraceae bacterium]
MAIAYSQPNNWLYDLQMLLLVVEHTNNPSTRTSEIFSFENEWQVNPNPSTGKVMLFNSLQKNDVQWELFNANGTQISNGGFSSNRESLDFKNIQEGLYFCIFRTKVVLLLKIFITR